MLICKQYIYIYMKVVSFPTYLCHIISSHLVQTAISIQGVGVHCTSRSINWKLKPNPRLYQTYFLFLFFLSKSNIWICLQVLCYQWEGINSLFTCCSRTAYYAQLVSLLEKVCKMYKSFTLT